MDDPYRHSSQHKNNAQIDDVRFSSDDTMIASCSGRFGQDDNSVRLWDVGTGKKLKKFQGTPGDCILRKVASLARSAGERSRADTSKTDI